MCTCAEYWRDSFWRTLACEATNLMKLQAMRLRGTLKWLRIVPVSVLNHVFCQRRWTELM